MGVAASVGSREGVSVGDAVRVAMDVRDAVGVALGGGGGGGVLVGVRVTVGVSVAVGVGLGMRAAKGRNIAYGARKESPSATPALTATTTTGTSKRAQAARLVLAAFIPASFPP